MLTLSIAVATISVNMFTLSVAVATVNYNTLTHCGYNALKLSVVVKTVNECLRVVINGFNCNA